MRVEDSLICVCQAVSLDCITCFDVLINAVQRTETVPISLSRFVELIGVYLVNEGQNSHVPSIGKKDAKRRWLIRNLSDEGVDKEGKTMRKVNSSV